jgi:glycosyltransferase involved in cell wall biosynthesis
MRVCLDIQAAIAQRAGVGRYTKMLAEHLGACAGTDALTLFYFDFSRKGSAPNAGKAERRVIRWCPGRLVQGAWKTLAWPPFNWFAGSADLYHFPNFILPPLTRGKAVVTVHDASFLRFPDMAEQRNRRYLDARIHETVQRADAIITDSAFSANEIASLLSVNPAKLFTVYPGISADIVRPDAGSIAAMRQALGLSRPYLLTVGTLEPRKNTPFLISVFEALHAFKGDLVIAGMPGWRYEPILERMRNSRRASEIRYLSYVPDGQLPALYAGAEALVFPSLYEGFGFPPLEAMACGTPVVASTGGSLQEVLGDGAAIVNDFDVAHWTETIAQVLANTDRRSDLIARGRQRAAQYTWEETARKTWEIYRKVAQ